MTTIEMVEKLRERANVSYDEAKSALDSCGGDLLDAMIYLERQGKVNPPQGASGFYSTAQEANPYDGQTGGKTVNASISGESFSAFMKRIWRWICNVVDKANHNNFEVVQNSKSVLSVPITILIILLICGFWVILPLLVIGLFCGCTYRFIGPEVEKSAVNDVMDSAAKAADNLKSEVMGDKNHHDDNLNI